MNKQAKDIIVLILAAAAIVIFDQAIKTIVVAQMALGESKALINGVFHITYVQNTGAAWSSFSGKTVFLLAITAFILILLIWLYIRLSRVQGFRDLKLLDIFVVGGAIGNMIDRVRLGYVVDMFDFCLINFPVFNVADIFVTCSMIILILLLLFKYKDDDLDEIFGNKKPSGD